jgi:hypothetical protein
MDWIDVAYGRDRKPSVENAVMKFLVPYNVGNFSTS